MRFKKIYIEITNSCNFNCSFCFKTERAKRILSVEEFEYIAQRIRPFTDYIYVHVLGEPLLHPHVEEILNVAATVGFQVNIVTNGSLLTKKKEYLLAHPVRQINISLHDAEENIKEPAWEQYINTILEFSTAVSPHTIISLRLWNSSNTGSSEFNQLCKNKISTHFAIAISESQQNKNGIKLSHNIYLQTAPRFEWPDESKIGSQESRNCYAMRDQVAILSNGDIVPCCLDAGGSIRLGNIFEKPFEEIINSERASNIKRGFEQRKIVEPLCKTCGFIIN